MTEQVTVDMSWATAVPMLIEIIVNGTPAGRQGAREELIRCARIADRAVTLQRELFDALAQNEGWAVFNADGSQQNRLGNCPLQIQRLDELELLESDLAAHRCVVEGAKDGKEHCLHALKCLRNESQPELALIYRNYLHLEEGDYLHTDDDELDALETVIFTKVVTRKAPSLEQVAA